MDWASSEVVGVLTFLLPGFVAAAVFYSLTSHPKPDTFDRVVLALIFTVIGQAIAELLLSKYQSLKSWELALTILVAVVLGLGAAYASNRDSVHRILRHLGITKETSYPSEWYSSFSRHNDCYVVLHLEGQRRLYGWPEEWPSHPEQGHFRISEGEWLTGESERSPATGVSAILISADEVEMVEFLSTRQQAAEEIDHGQGTDTPADEV